MARIMFMAAVVMMASTVVQADQCSSGGECPIDGEPEHALSLLQMDLQSNTLKGRNGKQTELSPETHIQAHSSKFSEIASQQTMLKYGTLTGSGNGWLVDGKLKSAWHSSIPEVQIHNKSIVIMGINKYFDQESIEAAATLCKFFDQGKCGLCLMVPDPGQEVLDGLKSKIPDVHVLEQPGRTTPSRTRHLANLRNAMIEGSMKQFPNFDYFVTADLDHTITWNEQTRSVILNVMTPVNEGRWDGVVFLAHEYYDWWAARCTADSVNCWGHPSTENPSGVACYDASQYSCITTFSTEQEPNAFLPISSAFNGLGIYKRDAFGDCRYSGDNSPADPTSTCGEDCEHVAFHRCLNEAGRKFMLNSGQLDIHWGG